MELSRLQKLFPESDRVSIHPIPGGASAKKFFRVMRRGVTGGILTVWDTTAGLEEFLSISDLFSRAGIRVPEILSDWRKESCVLTEDFGDQSLRSRFQVTLEVFEVYKTLVRWIATIRNLPPEANPIYSKRFDEKKYAYEFNFHVGEAWINGYEGIVLDGRQTEVLQSAYHVMVNSLLEDPIVPAHRDFQSSNVLWRNSEFCLVDFQDALLASPYYDLVSLLEDVYVPVPEDWKTELKTFFRTTWSGKWSDRSYDFCCIQRKLHDAGAFAYCYQRLGNPDYLTYILPVVQHAIRLADNYRELTSASSLLKEVIRRGRSGFQSQSPVDLL